MDSRQLTMMLVGNLKSGQKKILNGYFFIFTTFIGRQPSRTRKIAAQSQSNHLSLVTMSHTHKSKLQV